MSVLYDWMKNIIIFMILVTVVMNLLGKSSFKKYAGIVTGLILVLYVVRPLLSALGSKDYFDFSLERYSYNIQSEDMSDMLYAMENESNNAIMQEYKELIVEQTNNLIRGKGLYVTDMNIIIEDDTESENYGTIIQMDVKASYIKDTDTEKTIDPVTIDRIEINVGEKKEENMLSGYSPMEINIKNVLADFYNVESANINISIREDHNG